MHVSPSLSLSFSAPGISMDNLHNKLNLNLVQNTKSPKEPFKSRKNPKIWLKCCNVWKM